MSPPRAEARDTLTSVDVVNIVRFHWSATGFTGSPWRAIGVAEANAYLVGRISVFVRKAASTGTREGHAVLCLTQAVRGLRGRDGRADARFRLAGVALKARARRVSACGGHEKASPKESATSRNASRPRNAARQLTANILGHEPT